jgi:hypothetical protein
MDKAKDKTERYKLKDELSTVFTSSKPGLTGGAVGAVVGGWAASKAQVAYGKGEKNPSNSTLLTLLGAAVGGLAVNAAVEKWEESKTDVVPKQGERDEKFDSGSERGGSQRGGQRAGGGRSEMGGQSESGGGRRRGKSNRESKVYDNDSDGHY